MSSQLSVQVSGLQKTGKYLLAKFDAFFLMPASPRPLAVLRIALAVFLLAQALMLRSMVFDFFSGRGLLQGSLATYLRIPLTPTITTLREWLPFLNFSENTWILGVCGAYSISLLLLAVGFCTRPAAILVWFFHWVLMSTAESTTYGVDLYAHVFLFYLIWVPCGNYYSIDVLLGWRSPEPSSAARTGLCLLQLHLCITYLSSALAKAVGVQWWNGELLWRALSLPEYRQYDMTWLVNWPILAKIGGWAALALEFGYCFFIFPKRTRTFWIAAIVGLHLGIGIFLGLWLFAIMMCLLTLSIFGVSAQPELPAAPPNSLSAAPLTQAFTP